MYCRKREVDFKPTNSLQRLAMFSVFFGASSWKLLIDVEFEYSVPAIGKLVSLLTVKINDITGLPKVKQVCWKKGLKEKAQYVAEWFFQEEADGGMVVIVKQSMSREDKEDVAICEVYSRRE